MSKIDIDKLVVSYIETMNNSLLKTKVNAIKSLLKNQGLEVKEGEIVEIQESFNIEQGKQYVCIKDYIIGGRYLPTSCLFTKGKVYHSIVNGYLINNEGKCYYIYDSDKERYFRPATE